MLGLGLWIGNQAAASGGSGGGGGGGGIAAAVLNHTTSADKSSHLDVASPYYQFIPNAAVSAPCLVRATLAAANAKHHLEWKVDHLRNNVYFGYGEASVDYSNIVVSVPGSSGGGNGITCRLDASNTLIIYANGGLAVNTGLAVPAGDTIIMETDTGTNTVKFYQWHTSATLLATVTLTSQIPSSWIAFGGGAEGDATVGNSDAATFVPKAADWVMTPNTGFNNYYA